MLRLLLGETVKRLPCDCVFSYNSRLNFFLYSNRNSIIIFVTVAYKVFFSREFWHYLKLFCNTWNSCKLICKYHCKYLDRKYSHHSRLLLLYPSLLAIGQRFLLTYKLPNKPRKPNFKTFYGTNDRKNIRDRKSVV